MDLIVGKMCCYTRHDKWHLPECKLKVDSFYRIQETREWRDANGIIIIIPRIRDWWVEPESVGEAIFPPKWVVGDRVRVALKVEKEEGWDNTWSPRMTTFIGEEFTIRQVLRTGVRFVEDNEYGWPPGCLEPAN